MKRTTDHSTVAKPFLKWAGGKGQLLDTFHGFYPDGLGNGKINHYYEPFLGGGAVFFDVAQRFNIKAAYLYDVNSELVLTYKVVQNNVSELMEQLNAFQRKYDMLNSEQRKELFYKVRQEFNYNRLKINHGKYSQEWVSRAAQIIFMNKTCFNGLFRFNQKGEFNTPAGRYKNPKILDEKNLKSVSGLLQIAVIKNCDFGEVGKDIKPQSFVYFDPPYRPISKSAGFTAYSKNEFGDAQQIRLATFFDELDKKGVQVMLSNSDPKNTRPDDNFFDDLYSKHHIHRIPAKRMINSDATKRNAINEIVVTNYQV